MMRARTCSVCVNAACAECININDAFCRKDAVKALFETRFFETTEEKSVDFFFSPQTTKRITSFHLTISRSRKEKEMKKGKFSTRVRKK